MADKKVTFHLKPLSDKDIESLGLSYSDVWMLRLPNGAKIGPFATETLQEDSRKHSSLYENCQVFNMVTHEWKPFFKLPEFQRRKPSLVRAQNLIKNENFLLLIGGQKQGPFTLDELHEKIEDKEINLTQEVSVDAGKTWIKLYEHHAFDRRARRKQEELPYQPETQMFDEADEKTASIILNLEKQKEETSIISGLAFIGRGNDKEQTLVLERPIKKKKKKYVKRIETSHSYDNESGSIFKTMAIGAVAVIFIALGALSLGGGEEKSSPEIGQSKTVKSSNQIDNSDRSTRVRKPASAATTASPRQPKRYVPPKRKPTVSNSRNTNIERARRPRRPTRVTRRETDNFDDLNLDDPEVRRELSRELAGEEAYEDERDPYGDNNSEGNYDDNYVDPRDRAEQDRMEHREDDYGRQEEKDPYADQQEPYDSNSGAQDDYQEYGDFE